MKNKEKKDLHTKNTEELRKLLKDAQSSLFSARLEHSQNKLKNTTSIFTLGKQVAVLKTILNMKSKKEEKKLSI